MFKNVKFFVKPQLGTLALIRVGTKLASMEKLQGTLNNAGYRGYSHGPNETALIVKPRPQINTHGGI